jgi:hypothetical protein
VVRASRGFYSRLGISAAEQPIKRSNRGHPEMQQIPS